MTRLPPYPPSVAITRRFATGASSRLVTTTLANRTVAPVEMLACQDLPAVASGSEDWNATLSTRCPSVFPAGLLVDLLPECKGALEQRGREIGYQ